MIRKLNILGYSKSALVMIQDALEERYDFNIILNMDTPVIKSEFLYNAGLITVYEKSAQIGHLLNELTIIGAVMPKTKKAIAEHFNQFTDHVTIINDCAFVSDGAKHGDGCIFDANCSVLGMSKLGNHVTVYSNAVVSHHTEIGDYCTICPSATIAGNVKIGSGTFIGCGASVKNGITIGNDCIIGAGAVVVHDVADGMTVKGNPAK